MPRRNPSPDCGTRVLASQEPAVSTRDRYVPDNKETNHAQTNTSGPPDLASAQHLSNKGCVSRAKYANHDHSG